jgi:hypothetical protein
LVSTNFQASALGTIIVTVSNLCSGITSLNLLKPTANRYRFCNSTGMKKSLIILILLGLSSTSAGARSSCDIFFENARADKALANFNKIADFFGFENGIKTFKISFTSGRQSQYWTTENGKMLEQPTVISNYSDTNATIELTRSRREDWSFRWTTHNQEFSNKKSNELVFKSNLFKERTITDSITAEGNKLILNRSTVRTNPNSQVSIVINQTMTFSKNSDGTISLTSTTTSDSIRGNRILIGDVTEYVFVLQELK